MVEEQTVEVREKPRLLRRLAGYLRQADALEQQPAVDDLTGLRNQRALWDELERRARLCSPSRPLAVVIVDVDLFEDLSREYGPAVADAVLRRGASLLRSMAPSPRLAFRYGEKGFAVLAEAHEEEARELAESIRLTIAAQNGALPAATVSCGLAELDGPVEPWIALDRADAALRDAKRSGRNRVVVAGHTSPGERVVLVEELEHEVARRAAMALAMATLQVRDSGTADHSEDVVTLCDAVGRRLGFSDQELKHLAAGAQLHDVGKVAVPSEILNKPGALTDAEWAVIREHTLVGEQILRSVPEMAEVATIVRHSHEHWDGGGYPDGLSGEEIPRASRVILCADAFHAIRSDRPYRRGRSSQVALAELKSCSGTQFEPAVVDAFVSVAEQARTENGFVGPSRKRLLALLTALVIGCGSAVAAIPEVRDALRSVFGTTTGPSFAGTPATTTEAFDFGPLGDALLLPAKQAEGSKKDARKHDPTADRGDGRRSRRDAAFTGPRGGRTSRAAASCMRRPLRGRPAVLRVGPGPTSVSPRASSPTGTARVSARTFRRRAARLSHQASPRAGPIRRPSASTPARTGRRRATPSRRCARWLSRRRAAPLSARRRAAGSPAAAAPCRGPSRPPRPARAGPDARPSPCRSARSRPT